MRTRAFRVQALGGCALALAAVFAVLHAVQGTSSEKARKLPASFQVDVLSQEAAFPGKVITAKESGVDLLSYTCTPQDAAVAVLIAREKHTDRTVVPHVVRATDPDGRTYIAHLISVGQVSLLSIDSGFSKKPSSISVTINKGAADSESMGVEVTITKIAEPRRVLSPPSASEAAAAEKIVKATLDERLGLLDFSTAEAPTHDGFVWPHLVATSFAPEVTLKGRSHDLDLFLPDYYGKGIDAVKIRLDRSRYAETDSTWTYKNAKIVQTKGGNILWLPEDETIGAILKYTVLVAGQRQPPQPSAFAKHNSSHGEIRLRLFPKALPRIQRWPTNPFQPDAIDLDLIGTSPSLEELGLDTLRAQLVSVTQGGSPLNGFDKTLRSNGKAINPTVTDIPELKLRIRIRTPVTVSSTKLVLPVHHKDLGNTTDQPLSLATGEALKR